jgi:hypothetical protein
VITARGDVSILAGCCADVTTPARQPASRIGNADRDMESLLCRMPPGSIVRRESVIANSTERRVYRLCLVSTTIGVLALVVPRLVPNREGGLASAGTAILVFLGMLAVAALVAIYLLIMTVREQRQLSVPARIAGVAPGVVLVIALVLLFGFLRY